ncbi:MAG: hypothetical protein AB1758_14790, partial [Candidatus Eremiobacterota bacterium]
QVDSAYELLSSRARQRLTREEFRRQATDWLGDSRHRFDLEKRRPELRAPGRLVLPAQDPDEADWEWRVVREDGWRLDRLDGGPIRIPDG